MAKLNYIEKQVEVGDRVLNTINADYGQVLNVSNGIANVQFLSNGEEFVPVSLLKVMSASGYTYEVGTKCMLISLLYTNAASFNVGDVVTIKQNTTSPRSNRLAFTNEGGNITGFADYAVLKPL